MNSGRVRVDRTGQALLTRCTVTLNDTGLETLNAGVIYTAGDNAVFGNFSSNMDTGTVYLKPDLSAGPKQWHWMGNCGNVNGPVNVANQSGVAAGEMVLNFNLDNATIAGWMFY